MVSDFGATHPYPFQMLVPPPPGALPLAPHRSHMYHMNNFESPAPKDDSCHVWLKSDHAFSRRI